MTRTLACVLLLALTARVGADDHVGDPERGAVLAAVGGCASCHTADGGVPFAGGYRVDTRYGVFVGPNLTPDTTTGLGAWTYADFVRAMREGRAPDGHAYWPAFPYAWYTRMPDDQLRDLWAYLRTLDPVASLDAPHEIKPVYRGGLPLWRSLAFRPGPLDIDPTWADDVARGAVWVEGIGHCGGCHTPRDGIGRPIARRALSGSDEPPEPAPNLTPADGALVDWSHGDFVELLDSAMTPDGDVVGGFMGHIVRHGTARLTSQERADIAAYLDALPAVSSR